MRAVAAACSVGALDDVRTHFLGRKAELPRTLRDIALLPLSDRATMGQAGNELRRELDELIKARRSALAETELEQRLAHDCIDLTLPGIPAQSLGRVHLLTYTEREIEDIFIGLGFSVMEGPEVETVHYNFDALNHSSTHPARERTDTFYVNDRVILRTHTSPMEVRAMQAQPPPLFAIVPGRVYRRDSDATHLPQFHQVEGIAVAEGLTLADLKGTLLEFARQMFGPDRQVRLRGHFFPFTEPGIEVDVSCFNCDHGVIEDGSRCHICKGEQWLEILGAGMIHPRVLEKLDDPTYDPEKVSGIVWGMGLERIAMLKHGLPDLRLCFENDLCFLEQFG